MSTTSNLKHPIAETFEGNTSRQKIVIPEDAASNQLLKPKFRLDTDSSATFTLPNGRKLGYAQYGSLTGRPIFYLHGLPGSRMEGALYHDLGIQFNARIIAVDRPGHGWSSPNPRATLLSHSKEIEQLGEHLGLEEYGVLGVSGGGPSALACAKALPRDRLKCVQLIVGLGPPDIGMKGARFLNWVGFTFGWRYATTTMVRWFMEREVTARLDLTDEERLELVLKNVEKNKKSIHEKDLPFVTDVDIQRLVLRSTREAFSQGFGAVHQDGKLNSSDWGFRLEEIDRSLPITLWYSKLDIYVPANHGVQIAARLGPNARLRVEDETHASLQINWKREMFEDLVKSMG